MLVGCSLSNTAPAAQPDRAVEDVLERIFQIKDPAFKGVAPLALEAAAPPERPADAEAITP